MSAHSLNARMLHRYEEQTVSMLPDHELVVVRLGCSHPDRSWHGDAFIRDIAQTIRNR
jgi:hypothetical protein